MGNNSDLALLHRFGIRATMFGPTTLKLVRSLAAYVLVLEHKNAQLTVELQQLRGSTATLLGNLDLLGGNKR